MRGRTKGKQPGNGGTAQFQERDLVVLRMLLKARMLATRDFARYPFPSLPMARRRLAKLVKGRYIAGYCTALDQDTLYVLDINGWRMLEEHEYQVGTYRPPAKDIKFPGDHHMMLVRFWTSLIADAQAHLDIALAKFTFSWEMAPSEMIDVRTDMRPDAVVVLDDGTRRVTFFVEIDTGSESAAYFARHKVDLFVRSVVAGLPIAGLEPQAMLVVAPRSTRLAAIARGYGAPMPGILGIEFDWRNPPSLLDRGWVRLETMLAQPAGRCSLMASPEVLLSRSVRR